MRVQLTHLWQRSKGNTMEQRPFSFFQQMVLELWTATCKDTDYKPLIKINSEWITDLTIKCKTIKLLEVDPGENLDDLGYAITF